MRFTKIVATIGPATDTFEKIRELAKQGVNVVRLNFSHGDNAHHERVIASVKKLNAQGEFTLGIMLDTKGPEIRTGDVRHRIEVNKGETVLFKHAPTGRERYKVVTVDYERFARDARSAKILLIDNGVMEFQIQRIGRDEVQAKALEGGLIGSRRHVNIPGAYINLPAFTTKDWSDIRLGIKHQVEFFSPSFIRSAEDIVTLRRFLKRHGSSAEIIAKVETAEAVNALSQIVDRADGIMVARGDLGAEIPFEDVPRVQEEIVTLCRARGKTVIVATHMLESMILNPMPTRAEVTDIAHAAMSQTDATMLSGETASGMYPFKAVNAMHRVLVAAEEAAGAKVLTDGRSTANESDLPRHEQALAASVLAFNLQAMAIIVISKHGLTAKEVSHCRPHVPILAFSSDESVTRRLTLVWGIRPFTIPFSDTDPDQTVAKAIALSRKRKVLTKGDQVVILTDIRTGKTPVMTIQIRHIS